jgi:glutaredoxin
MDPSTPPPAGSIELYGASWCPDCLRAKRFLADQRIHYLWHDIDGRDDLQRFVEEKNDGKRIIPTIIFPDGSHLAEPTNEELAEKLGLARMAAMHVYDLVIVGGGPAGLTTSIYAARENLDTLVIDAKGLGGQAGVTERLDNYPGFPDGIGGAEPPSGSSGRPSGTAWRCCRRCPSRGSPPTTRASTSRRRRAITTTRRRSCSRPVRRTDGRARWGRTS